MASSSSLSLVFVMALTLLTGSATVLKANESMLNFDQSVIVAQSPASAMGGGSGGGGRPNTGPS